MCTILIISESQLIKLMSFNAMKLFCVIQNCPNSSPYKITKCYNNLKWAFQSTLMLLEHFKYFYKDVKAEYGQTAF